MNKEEMFDRFEVSFWELSRKMERLWNEMFMETFPGSQSKIVYMLAHRGPLKMSEIADRLQLTAGAVTTAAGHLIDHGYVERITLEKDRRVIQLQITDTGRETLTSLQQNGQKIIRFVFQHLEQEQLELIEQAFTTAIIHVDKLENYSTGREKD